MIIEKEVFSMNHYIKHMTKQVTSYINLSPEDKRRRKKKLKLERKQRRNAHRSSYSNEWLGIVPFVFKTLFKK